MRDRVSEGAEKGQCLGGGVSRTCCQWTSDGEGGVWMGVVVSGETIRWVGNAAAKQGWQGQAGGQCAWAVGHVLGSPGEWKHRTRI